MAQAPRDENHVPGMLGLSSTDGVSPVPVQVNPETGGIVIDASLSGGGDGAITDGASASIKATVLDYTGSNPLAVRLTDSNGDYVAAGAGTQYTEDAAAAANPVGSALIVVRDDSRTGSLVSADGDNIAVRGTNSGELYVKHVDAVPVTDNGGALTVDGTVTIEDGGGAITVDGTVTANLSATDNAVLDQLELNQDAQTDILTTIDTDTGGILTAVQLIDDTVYTDGTGTVSKGIAILGQDGTNPQAIKTDTDGELQVDVLSIPTVTVADGGSTLSVDDGGGALTVDGTVTVTATNLDIRDLTSGSDSVASVQSGTWTVQPGNTANTTPWLVTPSPATSGGLSLFRSIDLDETEEEIKATAGQLYGWFIYNDASAEVYVKLYNATAANVTVGTTTPVLTIPIPAGAAANVEFSHGIAFSTAITAAATTLVADNDTTAPAANQVIANFFYK